MDNSLNSVNNVCTHKGFKSKTNLPSSAMDFGASMGSPTGSHGLLCRTPLTICQSLVQKQSDKLVNATPNKQHNTATFLAA